jgi:hypothetical protein
MGGRPNEQVNMILDTKSFIEKFIVSCLERHLVLYDLVMMHHSHNGRKKDYLFHGGSADKNHV